MIIKIPTFDNKVRAIVVDGNTIEQMADHLIGKKLSKYRENIYDADGDGKVTLKDFIHRIKNVEGGNPYAGIDEGSGIHTWGDEADSGESGQY